jgi:hypothetical protein
LEPRTWRYCPATNKANDCDGGHIVRSRERALCQARASGPHRQDGAMKACSYQPAARGVAPAAPRAFCAPALLAAYAMGAMLWAPALVLVAGQFEGVLARVAGLPAVGAAPMFAGLWLLRFALYLVGAARRWDYGYGVNGVIVNRQLTLADKVQRIARDWFGILLILIWTGFMLGSLVAVIVR